MAFNLQKVLKALLFSSSQPLSTKDVQSAFARFHEQHSNLPLVPEEEGVPAVSEGALQKEPEPSPETGVVAPAMTSTVEPSAEGADIGEVPVATPLETDAELYAEVPSLITATQIREAMDAIAAELRTSGDVYYLIEGPAGYRLVTHPRFARWIRILRDEPTPVKLSQSALETLAIAAYRQPVTRTEIEAIRGVSAEAGLNKLIERELVYIVGRADLPGRPLQYGTTDKFLEFVGVKSLVELPASDVLSPRQIDEWLKNAINAKPPTDAEMGLPLEDGEGAGPTDAPISISREEGSRESQAPAPRETASAAEDVPVSEQKPA